LKRLLLAALLTLVTAPAVFALEEVTFRYTNGEVFIDNNENEPIAGFRIVIENWDSSVMTNGEKAEVADRFGDEWACYTNLSGGRGALECYPIQTSCSPFDSAEVWTGDSNLLIDSGDFVLIDDNDPWLWWTCVPTENPTCNVSSTLACTSPASNVFTYWAESPGDRSCDLAGCEWQIYHADDETEFRPTCGGDCPPPPACPPDCPQLKPGEGATWSEIKGKYQHKHDE